MIQSLFSYHGNSTIVNFQFSLELTVYNESGYI